MAWNKKEEEKVVVEPITGKDIENLRAALKEYKSNYRFRDYLVDLKVISVKNGAWVVHDPAGYSRLTRMNAKLELRQYYEDQEHFAQFPESKKQHLERLAGLRKGLAEKFKI